MEELWQKTSEMLWQRPILWVPVLAAELLGFFIGLGSLAILRAVVLHGLQYHSALGGAPVRAPMTAGEMEHASALAIVISWAANFIRLMLYATALVVTYALVHGYVTRAQRPLLEVGPAVQRRAAEIFTLALRALVVYGVAALLVNWLGRLLMAHHHKAILASGWVEGGVGVLLYAALAWLLAPPALGVLARCEAPLPLKRRAQIFGFTLGLVALFLGRFVATNLRETRVASEFAKGALELVGSWIAAVPYVVLFVGLGLIAWRCEREAENPVEKRTEPEAS